MPAKLTTEKFIEKSRDKHGDYYDYSKSIYDGNNIKITIICPIHGAFKQRPSDHYRYGCKKCGRIVSGNKQRCTKKHFIEKANRIHNNYYIYDDVNYIDAHSKVCIKCPKHGLFKQTPANHLQGQGCNDCANEKLRNDRHMSIPDYIEKGKSVHGMNAFNYSKITELNNLHSKITLICNTCKEPQTIIAGSHFKHGCNNCANKQNGLSQRKSHECFLTDANNVHGNYYEYLSIYTTAKEPICIKCPNHGPFYQIPYVHLSGCGCPKCYNNGTSKVAQEWINLLVITQPNLQHFYHKDGEFKIPGTRYKADGYNEDINTIFEFHGDYWHGNPKIYNKSDYNSKAGKTMGELYEKTKKKHRECEDLGYTYKIIWENDWIKGKMALKRIQKSFRKSS
jgi:hypothetical protein